MISCSAACNSPADPRFLCVPEIRAPPSRCPGWGCRGSDLQRASCWADWENASPSHPAPPSAHHRAALNEKKYTKEVESSGNGHPVKLKTCTALRSLFIYDLYDLILWSKCTQNARVLSFVLRPFELSTTPKALGSLFFFPLTGSHKHHRGDNNNQPKQEKWNL